MKYLKYFLIILFIPFIVLAEECDITNITITSLEQNIIEGNTEVLAAPTFEGRNINLNLKMFEVGDSITYDMTIKNESEEDYMIDENTFKTDSEYIEYTLKTNDNSNAVKSQSSKDVSLTVTYKKEVDDNLLNNNKFDASNNLKLSLNTNDKEKPLDTIVTDNIKESVDPIKVTNPQTESSNVKLIVAILVLVTIIIMFTIYSKKQYIKYFIILIPLFIIPMVYAICRVDIEVESTIEIEKKPKLYDTIVGLYKENNACVTKYEGEVTDEVNKTVNASNVYFDKCANQRNVIFGGFCWQVIRTTETGGTKVLYNGIPTNGKCESTRNDFTSFKDDTNSTIFFPDEVLFGDDFEYDESQNEFTITNTFSATWNDNTYEGLIGKYTCGDTTGTCNYLYKITDYYSNDQALVKIIEAINSHYSTIGKSSYNYNDQTLAKVGYMYNKEYEYSTIVPGATEYKYGSTFTYNNGTYTLSGITQNLSNLSNNITQLNNTHYTCWNTTGKCNTIYFIIGTKNSMVYYIELKNGKDVNDALTEMLSSDNVNKYNSSIKETIESWYAKNLINFTSMIEDTIYCNGRDIDNYGGWSETGQTNTFIKLHDSSEMPSTIICPNTTDQFAVSNPLAKLTYPIGLMSFDELYKIRSEEFNYVTFYWLMNANSYYIQYYYTDFHASTYFVGSGYMYGGDNANEVLGVRPVISIKNKASISSGTGSETDPWIVE